MSKIYYCAKCGAEIEVKQKAIPHEGRVIRLIKPHECEEVPLDNPDIPIIDDTEPPREVSTKDAFKILDEKKKRNLDAIFDSMPFVKKLNKATAEHEVVTQEGGDKRGKKDLREELVTSTAPLGILGMSSNLSGNNTPVHDLEKKKGVEYE